MRRLIPLLLLLGGCVHLPSFHLPKVKPVAAAPATPVCPGGLTADLEPEPQLPSNAGFPAPTTAAASAATNAYLTWLKALHDWGKSGWQRAYDAKAYCSSHN